MIGNLNRRCRDSRTFVMPFPALKRRAKFNRRAAAEEVEFQKPPRM